jgi:hypothetical protein
MEEEAIQKTDGSDAQHHHDEPAKAEAPEKHPNDGSRGGQKGFGWTVWLLVILIVLLFASSIANLVVSQRAYESSQKQVKAIEQLTQSIKAVQQSIVDLSRMIEQSPPEDEEPEDERDSSALGDGSI